MQEKQITPPSEEVTELNLENIKKPLPEDEKKQKDYEKRLNLFLKGFQNLEKKYKIKLLQIPARIIYNDQKYEN